MAAGLDRPTAHVPGEGATQADELPTASSVELALYSFLCFV